MRRVKRRVSFQVIDADSHIVLPNDDSWWRETMPKKYADWMPGYENSQLHAEGRIIEQPSATFHGQPTAAAWFGKTQGATYTPGSWQKDDPAAITVLEALKKGGLNPADRLTAMDSEGIDITYIFPSKVLGLLPALRSSAFAVEVARSYNNWIADYCADSEGRLNPIAILPQQDLILAVEEAERVRNKGFSAVMLRPNTVGGLNVDHPNYERLWSVCQEAGIAVMFHEGYGVANIPRIGVERIHNTMQGHMISHPFEHMMAVLLLITGGVMERFPRLRFGFMESGASWAPFWFNRMDGHAEFFAKDHALLPEKPSTYFKRQCFLGVDADDPLLPTLIDAGFEDTLLFASDFPHFDAPFPGAVDLMIDRIDITDSVKRKILYENGARLYGIPANAPRIPVAY